MKASNISTITYENNLFTMRDGAKRYIDTFYGFFGEFDGEKALIGRNNTFIDFETEYFVFGVLVGGSGIV